MNLEAKVSKGELAYRPKVLEVCMSKRLPDMIDNLSSRTNLGRQNRMLL